MVERRTTRVDKEFVAFMDHIAKSDRPNRNKIITDWLAFLDDEAQTKLINKLRVRGIDYVPSENRRFFEV
tara:strand:- start:2 stop:211 length:210 start_codon:yes stop_codon:yes gene_type:complete